MRHSKISNFTNNVLIPSFRSILDEKTRLQFDEQLESSVFYPGREERCISPKITFQEVVEIISKFGYPVVDVNWADNKVSFHKNDGTTPLARRR